MKKLITLLLVLTGMVGTASAKTLYIYNADPTNWTTIDVYTWLSSNPSNHNRWDDTHTATAITMGGATWYKFDIDDSHDYAIVRGNANHSLQTADIAISEDKYISVSGSTNKAIPTFVEIWTYPRFYNTYDGWYDAEANLATIEDKFTFSKVISKSTIGENTEFYFCFKAGPGPDGDWPRFIPQVDGDGANQTFSIATTTSSYWPTTNRQNRSWKVEVPSYDFNNIKLTATWKYLDGSWKWQFAVDAYISKTIGTSGYSTFGSAADVDFSKAEPALTSAQKGKVENDGTIIWTNATTLKGGEGALIQGTAGQTYSIPVTASASTDTEHNDFVAITETQQITQTMNGKNAYILVNGTDGLGFYKPASGTGSWCAAGTAYLNTSVAPASSRGFFPLWGDATAIESIESEAANNNRLVYDLQGRRVVNATKGLYVVNGKKVIIK